MISRALKWPLVAAAVAVVLAIAGVWLQLGERIHADRRYHSGDASAPDRVDVKASIQRVDAAGRELVLRVLPEPRGALADEGAFSPAEDLVLQTSSSVKGDLDYPAHTRISGTDVAVALTGGAITDYPFDGYDTVIAFSAKSGGRTVPVWVTLSNNDVLFSADVTPGAEGAGAGFDVGLTRSDSVLFFATFMMTAMWGLAFAVALGSRFLVTRRRGLVWPALGWMAATLFALAGFRNTAPGSPPIGSLIDYLAFLWVEALIAVCVIVTVIAGNHAEGRKPGTDTTTALPDAAP
ncbi:DUF4436 domain-containing protein [Yinghuangia seranimata]|uniref:DUF4436 domain-containing protein n=1 Tax=Yinghuangia seranimata TaxID=408067 RepID=UPI00248C4605|nr:DUF4436 domain-containing protein [Yinghuangia seranimata]MDI2125783.1 DUF4436 domain-containing protein [Yinghuangia seranimata]